MVAMETQGAMLVRYAHYRYCLRTIQYHVGHHTLNMYMYMYVAGGHVQSTTPQTQSIMQRKMHAFACSSKHYATSSHLYYRGRHLKKMERSRKPADAH